VYLDDLNLSVVSRMLNGRTIPHKSLSIGAQGPGKSGNTRSTPSATAIASGTLM
jgi:hypothetical protein